MNEKQPKAVIVIFGSTGDLANRKLFPSIYRLYNEGKINEEFAVVGVGRREWDDPIFRDSVKNSIQKAFPEANVSDDFLSHFYYSLVNLKEQDDYIALKELIESLEISYDTDGNRMFYLAMAPQFFGLISNNIKQFGLKSEKGWTRLVIEKPFGHDYPSAKALNEEIRTAFEEHEIYRIDHYLGKEMVQNIEVIRFANAIFEHLWTNQFIANVQVTSSESIGVEDRYEFYNKAGANRDMVQNHMLQMVALLAMEPPIKLTTDEIRSEKIKVLRALRRMEPEDVHKNFVRGQYGEGYIDGEKVSAYQDEHPLLKDSNTETFVAGRLFIDNYRWAGVPFYIRTGKRMTAKSTRIVVEFKDIPMKLYYEDKSNKHPNLLVIDIQPDEGVTFHMNVKKAGASSYAEPIKLSYRTRNRDSEGLINTPEAYEKLMYDCLIGDGTNFTHWDEVALSWKFIDTISEVWEKEKANFPNYQAGSMGPKEADELLAKDGFHWWSVID